MKSVLGVYSVDLFRPKLVSEPDVSSGTADQSAAGIHQPEQIDTSRSRRWKIARERDIQRGYSINVKQVVLAFAVEFWIIALIVVGTYLLITDSSGQLSLKPSSAPSLSCGPRYG
jgi:hypothetical protein